MLHIKQTAKFHYVKCCQHLLMAPIAIEELKDIIEGKEIEFKLSAHLSL